MLCHAEALMQADKFPILFESFDPGRMMYCYMIDKWNMPTCTKMSALAYRTYNSILEHLGVFHMPTFRLNVCGLNLHSTACVTH